MVFEAWRQAVSTPIGTVPTNRKEHVSHAECANLAYRMEPDPKPEAEPQPVLLYCPKCAAEVSDPLTCGDCAAIICRRCGTPLESPDELGIG